MILPLRRLGTVTNQDSLPPIVNDIQRNFDTLVAQVPQVMDELPTAGSLKFLAQEEDGSWHTYTLVAGAGVTINLDLVNKTVEFTSP